MTRLLLGILAAVFTGCLSQPIRKPAMIGGTPMRHPSEVFFGTCTGTMIASHIILTAGHCILGPDGTGKIGRLLKSGDQLLVQSFDGPNAEKSKRSFIVKASQVLIFPTWETAVNKSNGSADAAADGDSVNDLSLILLDQRLPVQAAQLPSPGIWENPTQDLSGVIVFGAGCQARGDDRTMGKLKAAMYTDIHRYPNKIELGPHDVITDAPAGPCKRDSGGGGFLLKKDNSDFAQAPIVGVGSIMTGAPADALAPEPTGFFLARIDKKEIIDWLHAAISKEAPKTLAPNLEP